MQVAGAPIWLYFLLRIIEIGMLITMTVFWLREMQRSLDACHPVSRAMEGTLVWITFIPLFGFVWQFICSKRVGDSLAREYRRRQWSNEEDCPGNEQGIVTGVVVCVVAVLRIFFWNQIHAGLFFIGSVGIGFCMYRHMDRLKAYRERLEKEFDPATAFGQIPFYPPVQPQWPPVPPNPQWQYPPPPQFHQPVQQYPPFHQPPPGYAPVPVYQPPVSPPQNNPWAPPAAPQNPPPPPDEYSRWRPKDPPPPSNE